MPNFQKISLKEKSFSCTPSWVRWFLSLRIDYSNIKFLLKGTGNTVVKAVSVLKDHSVLEENIVLANLFCTPPATQTIVTAFPLVSLFLWVLLAVITTQYFQNNLILFHIQMKILTSEIHPVAPNHFGQKYFGTDWEHSNSNSFNFIWILLEVIKLVKLIHGIF